MSAFTGPLEERHLKALRSAAEQWYSDEPLAPFPVNPALLAELIRRLLVTEDKVRIWEAGDAGWAKGYQDGYATARRHFTRLAAEQAEQLADRIRELDRGE